MLRILAGTAKGQELRIPKSARPTGARVRKSLFDILDQHYGEGCTFLDVYAGSGAVGLEAASRGYVVTLVERNKAAVDTLNKNARDLKLTARVLCQDAKEYLKHALPHDVVFIDPPYPEDLATIAQYALDHLPTVTDGVVIVQHPVQVHLKPHSQYQYQRREYGSNALSFYWYAEQ